MISYIDDDANTAIVRYAWKVVNASFASQTDLLGLALPHHKYTFFCLCFT